MTYIVTNPAKPTIIKDPDATLDYGWDFTDVLDSGDTIQSVVFTPDSISGLSVVRQSINGSIAYVWLTGGNVGTTGSVVCEYTTAQGRTDDRTLYFKISER